MGPPIGASNHWPQIDPGWTAPLTPVAPRPTWTHDWGPSGCMFVRSLRRDGKVFMEGFWWRADYTEADAQTLVEYLNARELI